MTKHFVTNFDNSKFLLKGLALYYSIRRNEKDFCLWNICMDNQSYEDLKKFNLPNLHLINVIELEDEPLLKIKKERTLREYCLTIKPYMMLHILNSHPEIELLTLLDSDLYFFQSAESIYEEFGLSSIGVTANNFYGNNSKEMTEKSGKFNAGFIVCRNNDTARSCLEQWRSLCLEWCSENHENGNYGEQIYMNSWPDKFEGVYVFKNFGLNAAYWNIDNYEALSASDKIVLKKKDKNDSFPLIFYHFSGLTLYAIRDKIRFIYNRRYIAFGVWHRIYRPYIEGLNWAYDLCKKADLTDKALEGARVKSVAKYYKKYWQKVVLSIARKFADPQIIRRLAKKILHSSVFFSKSYALNGIDKKMLPYLKSIPDGFFVEAGANDGISQSNTLLYEKKYGWKGLLVEPIPELALRCRVNRTNSIVENVALVSSTFRNKIITMRYCNLMSVVKGGMKSQAEEDKHIESGRNLKKLDTYEVIVATSTLSDLLSKHQISKIDYLSLDVEGYELEVLRGLDFNRYHPKYILVEARYKDEIDAFMKSVGYRYIEAMSHHDLLYSTDKNP